MSSVLMKPQKVSWGRSKNTDGETSNQKLTLNTEEAEPLKLEDVRAVLAELSRAGKTKDVRAKLDELGAKRLSEVDPARYPQLMAWAKEISNAR